MNLQTRQANLQDAQVLARIARRSFHEAFGDHPANRPEDLKNYMDEAFSVETISAELAEPESIYFIAEIDGEAVGYAKLKTDSREDPIAGENPLELCRLYALGAYVGKGIGRALMQKCLDYSAENRHDIVWLGVWELNYRAQEFYARFGFEKCGEHVFQLGSDPQTDWLMQKKI